MPARASGWKQEVTSRNDVRRELVFDEGDAIAQLQLALLQALDLDDVCAGRFLQRGNRGIEIAMLLLEARKLRPKLAFFLFCHFRLGRPPNVPIPEFARSCGTLRFEFRNRRTLVTR